MALDDLTKRLIQSAFGSPEVSRSIIDLLESAQAEIAEIESGGLPEGVLAESDLTNAWWGSPAEVAIVADSEELFSGEFMWIGSSDVENSGQTPSLLLNTGTQLTSGSTAGDTGSITIITGNNNSVDGGSGYVELATGDAEGGPTGTIFIYTASSANASSGDVTIDTGPASSAATTSGDITLTTGLVSGGAVRGDIVLTARKVDVGTTPISYSPAVSGNWAGTAPDDIKEALDRLAVVVKALNGGTGA
jgi:hypothetical protein